MAKRPVGDAERRVDSLADLRLSEHTLDEILGHVGHIGVATLEGWDAAGTTLVHGRKVATFGITHESVKAIDQAQYDAGKGPCVDALGGEVHYFDGQSDQPRWRQFAEAAADCGIYSVASFPLKLDDEVIGALNFYSGERDALRPGQREEGLLFAGQAAVALANAKEFAAQGVQVKQLEDGLQTRAMIGQATGLLMAQEGLTSEEAFQKLVYVSQTSNLKLRDIARRFVDAWEEKAKGEHAVN
ncbi:MAG: GAF and ANTAR domain-containing protein [Actinomycetota bacterium]|nr:GAF and ANTAR domain-containing protein [Actinomycetota bacterium]